MENDTHSLITETYRKREILQNVERVEESKPTINIITAFTVPRVPYYVVSYAMIKSCMNGLLFWVRLFLLSFQPI